MVLRMSNHLCVGFALGAMLAPGDGDIGDSGGAVVRCNETVTCGDVLAEAFP
jgi:hypothetical protein